MNDQKKLINMRLHPDLLQKIDCARTLEMISTRTAFVEEATQMYALYIFEKKSNADQQ